MSPVFALSILTAIQEGFPIQALSQRTYQGSILDENSILEAALEGKSESQLELIHLIQFHQAIYFKMLQSLYYSLHLIQSTANSLTGINLYSVVELTFLSPNSAISNPPSFNGDSMSDELPFLR